MARQERPLSPHLQIYRPQMTSLMSILHRATGVILAMGALLFVVWLYAASLSIDDSLFARFQAVLASLPGKLALFAFSTSLIYHFFNGIRHLLWDIGWGYEISRAYFSGYTVLTLSVATTTLIWASALAGGAI